jgi:hypothetical protein
MLASGIRRRGCFRDEARRHGDPSDLADDGGRRRCAGPSRTRTWRTRCSGWSAYVVVIDNNLVRSGVQAIGMAVRNYLWMRRVRDGHDVHIRIVKEGANRLGRQ